MDVLGYLCATSKNLEITYFNIFQIAFAESFKWTFFLIDILTPPRFIFINIVICALLFDHHKTNMLIFMPVFSYGRNFSFLSSALLFSTGYI